jgi:hypothetical protein
MEREKFLWLSHKFYYDFIKWVHFSEKKYQKERNGMRPCHLQITPDVTLLLLILKHFPLALKLFIKSPLYLPLKLTTQGFYKKSHLAIVEAQDYSDQSIINAAGKTMTIWIDQETKGHSLQPMNISLLPYIDYIRSNIDVEININKIQNFTKEFKVTKSALWIFRIGKVKKLSRTELTLRK